MAASIWDLIEIELDTNLVADKKLHSAVRELNQLFTSRRSKLKANYFTDPRILAAYLAYYLPLNHSKTVQLLENSKDQILASLRKKKTLSILDFGSGPGTATLAFLQFLRKHKVVFEKIEIEICDHQKNALDAAESLISKWFAFSRIAPHEITVTKKPKKNKYDFIFALNVLNEIKDNEDPLADLAALCDGLFLIIEPSHRVASQRLVRLRNRIIKNAKTDSPMSLIAPCLHADKCPLDGTQHWCHFSEPVVDDNLVEWNKLIFKDSRIWLKYSYLLFESQPCKPQVNGLFRAIGDRHASGPEGFAIDLCRPNTKWAYRFHRQDYRKLQSKLFRGALVELSLDSKLKSVELPTSFQKRHKS